ncbi:MAG: phosphatidylserine decarboxylase family protein [Desulfarculaceae bacterium]|nr:phosphatidylserine decarboxylase family protein [Desulfarculaceae bacterium]MCF8071002.1 phosphatidylserine decarboxylase family protein [Desulfarculaceae bacterium]MCF8100590.1 phosphatidylserine decarboxylase family protein [Desulfarculaceae bacterium]MCF8117722.1 phosphatidylserine decarboxylase family protein [Desulfarculaceae bacterium]
MDKFPLARPGWPYALGSLFLALVAGALLPWWLAAPLWIVCALILNFFRDPARSSDAPENAVLSPADGKVVVVQETTHPGLPGGKCLMVSIFMNIFDVHVNRAPMAGRVMKVVHHPGGYLPADRPQASTANERVEMTLASPSGATIVVAQVAGLVARRIECWVAGGVALARGHRYGMIRFGSRLDLYLPLGAQVEVAPGQRVRAGQTVIAEV